MDQSITLVGNLGSAPEMRLQPIRERNRTMPGKQTFQPLAQLVEDIKAMAGDISEMAERLINQCEPVHPTYILTLTEADLRTIATALQCMARIERNLVGAGLSERQALLNALRENRHLLWEIINIPEEFCTGGLPCRAGPGRKR